MNILETKNLKVKYDEKTILEDINLKFEKGKVYSILGANGCGKTTLLKALSKSIKHYEGEIYLNGTNIKKIKNKEFSKNIASLSQSYDHDIDLKVKELVSYGRNPYKRFLRPLMEDDKKIIDWALDMTNLNSYRERRINKLSGGERQRVWLAMAIAQKAKILLLDEPTSYLDISHQIEILDLVKSINEVEKNTVIMVLHDINHALKYSDEIIIIDNKKIICKANMNEILKENYLDRVFKVDSILLTDSEIDHPIYYPKGVTKVN